MEESAPDRAAVRFPPPLVFVAAILLAAVGERRIWRLPLDALGSARIALAILGFAVGIGLLVAALVHFRRTGQNPEPWKPTPELVSAGPYRLSRNPIYLGLGSLQLAAGFWVSSGWILLTLPLSLVGVYYLAIRPEETYLERKFGDEYRRYKRQVRRWL